MTLRPVTDPMEAKAAFEMLQRNLTRGCQRIVRTVGWKGGSGQYPVYWNPDLRFWSLLRLTEGGERCWCCFGTQDATWTKTLSITGQINPPVKGVDHRAAGAFLSDDSGHIYLAHSGKITGGRPGIGKSAFVASYRGENWHPVLWPDGRETEMIVIGRVDGTRLRPQVGHFIEEVRRFKRKAAARAIGRHHRMPTVAFRPEFSGSRKAYRVTAEIEGECDDGLVVEALQEELERRGLRVANDQPRDFFLVSPKGRITALFEIKTVASSQAIYTAVAQLAVNSAFEPRKPKCVLVVPKAATPKTRTALGKLAIEVLTYRWDGDQHRFVNLDRVMR